MKPVLLTLLLASSLGALAADALTDDNPPVTISASPRSITLPDSYVPMRPDEHYDYLRDYTLANGMVLSVYNRGERVYAALGDMPRHEMVAATANTFYARDGKLKMTIDLHGDSDASGEVYALVPAPDKVAGETVLRIAMR